ncbi:hypothetical protein CVD28_07130 [Bacillus sp. M6-12]|uniref:hypothetical protein n=1 Tax=Bacillus sp. M6-12 TaxID=2054166 RepID=UPI000CC6FE38|nr:hypothetical protein [Bacillus sp. M6-12]PLS18430.1 hypothetical protein CVD28_07130 [Bacillus sp. M6-12]
MDSIEHRVAVNQIELSDIKEALQRMEDFQTGDLGKVLLQLLELTGKLSHECMSTVAWTPT